ncbi:CRISPR-associated endoribonuclease Cas6 [Thermonema lapsum]|uniref:CRISPR-associated endoribonuclease Cas6 n=1 Tax=Thermonema lapsum TaxID=28195 RepID=A0A846MMJ3_9BACT|nr:CRISPR-associated endoribonuclease Cas6 [Thermonema lapsum]NIK72640.1 CRISPR-associated endoribonuclease Cas6 [Thermonema lapsum]
MRVRIIFSMLGKAIVPFHHQPLIAQMIKVLRQQLPAEDASYTHYHFSSLKGQIKVQKNGLLYQSKHVTLVFAALSPSFVQKILKALFAQPKVCIGNLWLKAEYVEEEVVPELPFESKMLCLSPLLLIAPQEDAYNAKRLIPPTENLFSDLVYESTILRAEASGLYDEATLNEFHRFQIVPDENYLKQLAAQDKKYARLYEVGQDKSRLVVRGYSFPFTLYAHPLLKRFIMLTGLGALPHLGYGMLDLASGPMPKHRIDIL